MRLSTDIDIIVAPDTDVDTYISKASTIFPFKQCEEQVRIGRNSIEKRHFKFTYQSPVTGKDIYILLDILFSENPYTRVVDCEIRNDLLLTEPEYLLVKTPDINCILGDKLTAFAPHTTGIPLNESHYTQIYSKYNRNLRILRRSYFCQSDWPDNPYACNAGDHHIERINKGAYSHRRFPDCPAETACYCCNIGKRRPAPVPGCRFPVRKIF